MNRRIRKKLRKRGNCKTYAQWNARVRFFDMMPRLMGAFKHVFPPNESLKWIPKMEK